jgi:hypothetical protein
MTYKHFFLIGLEFLQVSLPRLPGEVQRRRPDEQPLQGSDRILRQSGKLMSFV